MSVTLGTGGVSLGSLVASVAAVALLSMATADRDEPEIHEDILEHFKYGSIGTEGRAGVPWEIWRVMPTVCSEHLPDGPGQGYERFGFVYESEDSPRPIGTSYRVRQIPLLGLNCAACHTGTLRDA